MTKCPCCGAEMDFTKVDQLLFIELPAGQRKILDCLVERHPRKQTIDQLIKYVYAFTDEPNYPEQTLYTQLVYLRRALKAHGWTIPQNKPGRGNRQLYGLVAVSYTHLTLPTTPYV